jgi:hypothetical protein
VSRILPQGGLIGITGQPSVKKTFFALDMACSIASGVSFLGRTVIAGHVVYIAAEGARGLHKRLLAWEKTHGIQQVPDERLAFIPEAVTLNNLSELQLLIDTLDNRVRDHGPVDVVFVDTLGRSFMGNENTSDMMEFIRACDCIRQRYSCAVALVLHTPKDTSERSGAGLFRGHSSLYGALDGGLRLKAKGDQVDVDFTAKPPKDGEPLAVMSLKCVEVDLSQELGADEQGDAVTSLVLELDAGLPNLSSAAVPISPSVGKLTKENIVNQLKAGPLRFGELVKAIYPQEVSTPE